MGTLILLLELKEGGILSLAFLHGSLGNSFGGSGECRDGTGWERGSGLSIWAVRDVGRDEWVVGWGEVSGVRGWGWG